MIEHEQDILSLIQADQWMMKIIQTAKRVQLPDWWICAGFVRSKVWDTLHEFSERTPLPDIDVVYYDAAVLDEAAEKKVEAQLHRLLPGIPWSVKNEARMHVKSNTSPYLSTGDAIGNFPETATAVGVKVDEQDNLRLTAPCGIHDLIHLEVRPNPRFVVNQERREVYESRVKQKNWPSRWPKLNVYSSNGEQILR